ncbi:MAG TPA: formate--tetrahydrofolate ligase [Gaiellaceae bacterium]|nr:formate--tetrahydrofolate ligase [Gaiellaceae bacterium]
MAVSALPSSLEIAQAAQLRPIAELAAELGLEDDELEPYGRFKAKISLSVLDRLRDRPDGKLVAVTAITPTTSGEGKTTTAVGLVEGLARLGRRPLVALREPSLGPVFGIKGGAAGGGHAQVVPMEDLNLHFTGDIHAITAANNLLAAMVDAHLLHGREPQLDAASISFRRCLDINDRALRHIVLGLGGRTHGVPREAGFDITAASEVMGIMAVARDLPDLRARVGAITVGRSRTGERVTAEDLGAAGAMAVLLRDALNPNLVQTLEGQPALVHIGPFGNIASGNNSLVADRVGLKLADYVVTESGFGSDMGFEKLMDIVAPLGGLRPDAAVLVATAKTMRAHADDNLARHVEIVRGFGLEPVVAVNRFPGDSDADVALVVDAARDAGAIWIAECDAFERGGAGAEELAAAVVEASERPQAPRALYEPDAPLEAKITAIATRVYGAADVHLEQAARTGIEQLAAEGLGGLPVVMAKTHLSLSHDPLLGASPSDFVLPVRDVQAYTGAGWVVALCGAMQTMPGLGKEPAALRVDLDGDGRIVGLF